MANLPALYAEAWAAPRQSMRRILDMKLSERDRLIMVAVTFVLFAIPFAGAMRGATLPDGRVVTTAVILQMSAMLVAIGIISYYITAALLKAGGAVFGGSGSYDDCKSVAAWSQFVTGLANFVVFVIGLLIAPGIAAFLQIGLAIAAMVLLAAYAAEAHGFRSVIRVAGVIFAASLVLALILTAMIPAEMLQRPS